MAFYFHLITASAAGAGAAVALIGLFCLIMIIGFYDSLIMRWCIEKIELLQVGKSWLFVRLFLVFLPPTLLDSWRGVEHFVEVDGLSVSQATQLPDRQCRLKTPDSFCICICLCRPMVCCCLNYVKCAFEDNLNGRRQVRAVENKHELRWPRNARKAVVSQENASRPLRCSRAASFGKWGHNLYYHYTTWLFLCL